MVAALVAKSAQEQGKFWEFHDKLFQQRGSTCRGSTRYAREVGLDMTKVHADLEALRWGSSVQRDLRQARRLGSRGRRRTSSMGGISAGPSRSRCCAR
jgi:hypothetical protein